MPNSHIRLLQGDITKIEVDAIVNAANSSLMGGGGVDGAIHKAGGSSILEECKQIGGCPPGEAVVTNAGSLPVKKVIHTVGPIWNGGQENEPEILRRAYWNSLKIACHLDLMSIAFPNISTGVYGYPKDLAAEIAINSIQKFTSLYFKKMEVTFVCYDDENYTIYSKRLKILEVR